MKKHFLLSWLMLLSLIGAASANAAMSLPVSLTPTADEFAQFTIIDNSSAASWVHSTDRMKINTYSNAVPDDWAILPAINFPSTSNEYTLTYTIATAAGSKEDYEVYIGKAADVASMTQVLIEEDKLNAKGGVEKTVTFTVPEAGDYYIGFRASSQFWTSYGYWIEVYNINVEQVGGSAGPAYDYIPTASPESGSSLGRISEFALEFDESMEYNSTNRDTNVNQFSLIAPDGSSKTVWIDGLSGTGKGYNFETEAPCTELGTYTITFPQGIFWNADKTRYNPEFTITYTVEPVTYEESLTLVSADPADGSNVEELKSVKVRFAEGAAKCMIEYAYGAIPVVDDKGNVYNQSYIYTDWQGEAGKDYIIKICDAAYNPATADGTYTITIPVGTILSADETKSNPEITLTYTIGEQAPAGPTEPFTYESIIPDPAVALESLQTVVLTFPYDVTYDSSKLVLLGANMAMMGTLSVTVEGNVATISTTAPITEKKAHELAIPANTFVASNGVGNAAISEMYTVAALDPFTYDFNPTTITPADGAEVEELSQISLTFDEMPIAQMDAQNDPNWVIVEDQDQNMYSATLQGGSGFTYNINIAGIENPGTYNVFIPANTFQTMAAISGAGSVNPEIRLSYTVVEAGGGEPVEALELPVAITPTADEFAQLTIINANADVEGTDYYTWKHGGDHMYCPYNAEFSADDWAILPAINFPDVAKTYSVSLEASGAGSNYPEKFEVYVGNAPTVEAMTQQLMAETVATAYGMYNEYKTTFQVAEAGNWYVAVRGISDANMNSLYVRNIKVTEDEGAVAPTVLELPVAIAPTADEFAQMTIIDNNNDYSTWKHYGNSNEMYYSYHSQNNGDDWAILPAINFPDAAAEYTFSLEANEEGYKEKFEVYVGKTAEIASMTKLIMAHEIPANSEYTEYTANFQVEEAGEWYVAIRCNSDADMYRLYVRNIKVEMQEPVQTALELPVAITPTADEFAQFTVIDSNADGKTWTYEASNEMYYPNHSTNNGDDWAILPAINFPDAAAEYTFSMEAKEEGYAEKFEVYVGKTAEIASMTQQIMAQTIEAGWNPYAEYSANFQVAEAGNWYIAIRCNSDADKNRLWVRNIKVTKVEGSTPDPQPTVLELPVAIAPTADEFAQMTVINANDDSSTWTLEGEWMQYFYHPTNQADDWAILPGINFTDAAAEYTLTYDLQAGYFNEAYEVYIGNAAEVAALTTKLYEETFSTAYATVSRTVDFQVAEAGTWYIAFRARSAADMERIKLNNIKVEMKGGVTPPVGGVLQLPVFITPTADEFANLTIVDANGDGTKIVHEANKIAYNWNSNNQADDWAILPAINFPEANTNYTLAFDLATRYYYEGYEVLIGKTNDITSMNKVLITEDKICTSGTIEPRSVVFQVEEAGEWYIAFRVISAADQESIYFSNISVVEGGEVPGPGGSEMVITPAEGTELTQIDNDTFEITFEGATEVTINESVLDWNNEVCTIITPSYQWVSVYPEAVEGKENTFRLVRFEQNEAQFPLTEAGAYGLWIVEGAFIVDGNPTESYYVEEYVTVGGGTSDETTMTITPEEGASITSLDDIRISFNGEVTISASATDPEMGMISLVGDNNWETAVYAKPVAVDGEENTFKLELFEGELPTCTQLILMMEEGVFSMNGTDSPAVARSFTMSAQQEDPKMTVTPEEGATIVSIDDFRITFNVDAFATPGASDQGMGMISFVGDNNAETTVYAKPVAVDGEANTFKLELFEGELPECTTLTLSIKGGAFIMGSVTSPSLTRDYVMEKEEELIERLELPVSLEPTQNEYDSMKHIDNNNDGRYWLYDSTAKRLFYPYSPTNAADDWAFLPVIKFPDVNGRYEFSVDATGINYPESFEVWIGKEAEIASMDQLIMTVNIEAAPEEFKTYKAEFYIEEAGDYYVAIKATSAADQNYLYLKNIKIGGDFDPNADGVETILFDSSVQDIYSVNGMIIKRNATSEDFLQLENGIYIINGKKVYKK